LVNFSQKKVKLVELPIRKKKTFPIILPIIFSKKKKSSILLCCSSGIEEYLTKFENIPKIKIEKP
jgi:hypothetical protein